MLYCDTYSSPVGKLTLISDKEYLIGLYILGQKYYMNKIKEQPVKNKNVKILNKTKLWLDDYFSGRKPNILDLKIKPNASDFQREVLSILCKIPYGKTTTYKEISEKVKIKMNKKNMSPQAIGGAVSHNPISIIIPCHRVVGSDGNLTGYAGGIDKKIKLLELEGVDTSKFYIK